MTLSAGGGGGVALRIIKYINPAATTEAVTAVVTGLRLTILCSLSNQSVGSSAILGA